MATYYLKTYGRPNVKWGILLETDGQPNYGGNTGDPQNYTCAQTDAEASTAKATKNANGEPIEIFTVGFGIDGNNNAFCPDNSGFWNGKHVTTLLASVATQPSLDNLCTPQENTDGDHFFCEPKTTDLTAVFSQIATSLSGKGFTWCRCTRLRASPASTRRRDPRPAARPSRSPGDTSPARHRSRLVGRPPPSRSRATRRSRRERPRGLRTRRSTSLLRRAAACR